MWKLHTIPLLGIHKWDFRCSEQYTLFLNQDFFLEALLVIFKYK
jgi:hypothetical protein